MQKKRYKGEREKHKGEEAIKQNRREQKRFSKFKNKISLYAEWC